jgi:hypothetical protein
MNVKEEYGVAIPRIGTWSCEYYITIGNVDYCGNCF